MRSAKWNAFRLSSKHCSTCQELSRLNDRIEVTLRDARSLYTAAVTLTDSAALQNLEEELKQTSAAHRLVCYAVDAHMTNQHSQTWGVRLAA
jgi:hypothetical protein